jgi:hypothetical protein
VPPFGGVVRISASFIKEIDIREILRPPKVFFACCRLCASFFFVVCRFLRKSVCLERVCHFRV